MPLFNFVSNVTSPLGTALGAGANTPTPSSAAPNAPVVPVTPVGSTNPGGAEGAGTSTSQASPFATTMAPVTPTPIPVPTPVDAPATIPDFTSDPKAGPEQEASQDPAAAATPAVPSDAAPTPVDAPATIPDFAGEATAPEETEAPTAAQGAQPASQGARNAELLDLPAAPADLVRAFAMATQRRIASETLLSEVGARKPSILDAEEPALTDKPYAAALRAYMAHSAVAG